ncbi:PREDICTED: hybrid signal transduction histidine kinase L-like [Ceratosolen solmsi marchali]|uniref:Hybrid signal transduction histidine kinase L-like n=1 Tax=Ceratosolen solmsi marchali TaxID=326594 RepID=A0AAJ6YUL2_9HYME|nr:PREDICTED: hybrid signal transduction histidine kinase L-like [Ceratosolen solmsi marchali]
MELMEKPMIRGEEQRSELLDRTTLLNNAEVLKGADLDAMQETSLGAAPVSKSDDETLASRRPRLEVREEFRHFSQSEESKPKCNAGPFPGGYRPSFPYGFLPFYGLPQTPPSFSPERAPAGTKSRTDEATFRPNEAFAHHERLDATAFHHHHQHQHHHHHQQQRQHQQQQQQQHHYHHDQQQQQQQQKQQQHRKVVEAYAGGFQGAPYASFRAPYRSISEQKNNSYARSPPYPGKHRKWSNSALRVLHPPASWSPWYFRPETPFAGPYRNHVLNLNASSDLSSFTKPQLDLKRFEAVPERANKIHGQTPTICTSIRCTVTGCTCESFTPGKRHLRCCENCRHGWVPHDDMIRILKAQISDEPTSYKFCKGPNMDR